MWPNECDRWLQARPGSKLHDRSKAAGIRPRAPGPDPRAGGAPGATNVRVCGSATRGDGDEASDVDFLVEMEEERSLLNRGGLLTDLKDLSGRDVDVVTETALSDSARSRVLD